MTKGICVGCGTAIDRRSKRCYACSGKERRVQLPVNYCRGCGIQVPPETKQFCRTCFEANAVKKPNCTGCGKRLLHVESRLCSACYTKEHILAGEQRRDLKTEKYCPACGEIKPLSEFFRNKARLDGLAVQCRDCHSAGTQAVARKIRLKVIEKYGAKCVKCGFSDERALQLDHVNGNGAAERSGTNQTLIYQKSLSDTTGAYQLLCANCNWIKRNENGEHSWAYTRKRRPRQEP